MTLQVGVNNFLGKGCFCTPVCYVVPQAPTKRGNMKVHDSQRSKVYAAEQAAWKELPIPPFEAIPEAYDFIHQAVRRKTFQKWFPLAHEVFTPSTPVSKRSRWHEQTILGVRREVYGQVPRVLGVKDLPIGKVRSDSAARFTGYGPILLLPETSFGLNKLVVVHELSHAVVWAELETSLGRRQPRMNKNEHFFNYPQGRWPAWHGREFTSTMLKLTQNLLGAEAAETLKAQYKLNKVKYSRVTQRKEMSPERLEWLRQHGRELAAQRWGASNG